MSRTDGDPVAHRLVHRVLEGRRPGGDGDDLGAEDLHPEDVVGLPPDVLLAHEDPALHPEERRRRRGGHAVLARPGLGDHLFLPHPPGEEDLPQGVVDLVRARVVHVLPLEVDLRAAEGLGEPPRLVEGRLPPRVLMEIKGKLLFEGRILAGRAIGRLQLQEGGHQGFRRIASPEDPEMAVSVRLCPFHHIFISFRKLPLRNSGTVPFPRKSMAVSVVPQAGIRQC